MHKDITLVKDRPGKYWVYLKEQGLYIGHVVQVASRQWGAYDRHGIPIGPTEPTRADALSHIATEQE